MLQLGSSSKAMMLELGALVDMKPMRGIQTIMLNTVRIMAGILAVQIMQMEHSMLLAPVQIMQMEHSMPHMEEGKVEGMLVRTEGSMAADTTMLRQCRME
jgi:hypothetical protein